MSPEEFEKLYNEYKKNKNFTFAVGDSEKYQLDDVMLAAAQYARQKGLKTIDLNFLRLTTTNALQYVTTDVVDELKKYGIKFKLENVDISDQSQVYFANFQPLVDDFNELVKHWAPQVKNATDSFSGVEIDRPMKINLNARKASYLFSGAKIFAPVTIHAPNLRYANYMLSDAEVHAPVTIEKAPWLTKTNKMFESKNTYMFDISESLNKVVLDPERLKMFENIPEKMETANKLLKKLYRSGYALDIVDAWDYELVFYDRYEEKPSDIETKYDDDDERDEALNESVICTASELQDVKDFRKYFPNIEASDDEIKALIDIFRADEMLNRTMVAPSNDDSQLYWNLTVDDEIMSLPDILSAYALNNKLTNELPAYAYSAYANFMAKLKGKRPPFDSYRDNMFSLRYVPPITIASILQEKNANPKALQSVLCR